jgi:hypothetical protein
VTYRRLFVAFYYSLPVQLFVEQLRRHRGILLFWLVLFFILTRTVMAEFGAYFVVLEPEIGGEITPLSMFVMGCSIGLFCLAYQITCFLLDGHKYYFLAMERRAFLKFAYNNAFIPTLFWIMYLWEFVLLRDENPNATAYRTVWLVLSSLAGMVLISALFGFYFGWKYLDPLRRLGDLLLHEVTTHRVVIKKAREALGLTRRVEYFFKGPLTLVPVPDTVKADLRQMVRVMDRNNVNAFGVVVLILLAILSCWLWQDVAHLDVPAGASFFLLFSLAMMATGALSYWFRRVGPISLLIVVGVLYFFGTFTPLVGEHRAFGVSYAPEGPSEYSHNRLEALTVADTVHADSLLTVRALERWKAQVAPQPGTRPLLVLVMTSGGGNRSAYWVTRCLQRLDSLTQSAFWQHVRVVSGASGGMVGAAYYRELHVQRHRLQHPTWHPPYAHGIAQDLLNPIIFNVVANLFLVTPGFEWQGQHYDQDAGFAFEERLMANAQATTGADLFRGRCLGHYAAAESLGLSPQVVFTPGVVNDGRQMVITALPASYYCAAGHQHGPALSEPPAAEFRRVLAAHRPDSLWVTTAIRASATFPYILPNIELPTEPRLTLADAGVIDNFGTRIATRFLYTFSDWLAQNTAGVVLLQIRDSERAPEIAPSQAPSIFNGIFNAAHLYGTLSQSRDYLDDDALRYALSCLRCPVHSFDLQYIPSQRYERASLNFHLSARERSDIDKALDVLDNRITFEALQRLFAPGPQRPPSP